MTIYDISEIKGDTWDGAEFTVTDKATGSPINLTGCSIALTVRASAESPTVVHSMAIGTGLVLTAPTLGKWAISPNYLWPMPAGSYVFAVRITLSDGRVKTWLKGSITLLVDTNRA